MGNESYQQCQLSFCPIQRPEIAVPFHYNHFQKGFVIIRRKFIPIVHKDIITNFVLVVEKHTAFKKLVIKKLDSDLR